MGRGDGPVSTPTTQRTAHVNPATIGIFVVNRRAPPCSFNDIAARVGESLTMHTSSPPPPPPPHTHTLWCYEGLLHSAPSLR
mmetsp:Transcript_15121/g.21406  ORF Transcript_15121/g.21406 Transcript_15121/m.21406 type:complete len:82 (+) Transcript_15121:210-455(+)